MSNKEGPRLIVTAAVFILFAYILYHNRDNEMLIGAMIGAMTAAVGYWLGSSKGSSDKSTQLAEQASNPQPVEVVNDHDEPVPVEPHP